MNVESLRRGLLILASGVQTVQSQLEALLPGAWHVPRSVADGEGGLDEGDDLGVFIRVLAELPVGVLGVVCEKEEKEGEDGGRIAMFEEILEDRDDEEVAQDRLLVRKMVSSALYSSHTSC